MQYEGIEGKWRKWKKVASKGGKEVEDRTRKVEER